MAHAAELGADPARVILGGDSAGGNLAAVTALRLRDAGGPKLLGQLLLYPVTDWHQPGWPSYVENAEGYGLTRATMEWFWGHYVPRPEGLTRHPHVAPIHAPDLAGLPPALLLVRQGGPDHPGDGGGNRLAARGLRRRAPQGTDDRPLRRPTARGESTGRRGAAPSPLFQGIQLH